MINRWILLDLQATLGSLTLFDHQNENIQKCDRVTLHIWEWMHEKTERCKCCESPQIHWENICWKIMINIIHIFIDKWYIHVIMFGVYYCWQWNCVLICIAGSWSSLFHLKIGIYDFFNLEYFFTFLYFRKYSCNKKIIQYYINYANEK